MMMIRKLGFMLVLLVLISACKGLKVTDIKNDDPKITLLISHYKVECDASFKRDLCLQIKTKGSNSSTWEKYAADIKNFTYKWGFDYEIEVTYQDISPKPSDAPSREYTLVKKISEAKTLDTSLFVLTISRDGTTSESMKKSTTDSTLYKIYTEVDIKCDSTTDECTTIEDNINQDNAIKLILSHHGSINNQTNISSIPCASARNSFKTDCK